MKIKLATKEERQNYGGIYPLHGTIETGGFTLVLEDLRSYAWIDSDPKWEVLAPKGHYFDMQMTHSLLGMSQADIKERVSCYPVVKCEVGCSCGYDVDEGEE